MIQVKLAKSPGPIVDLMLVEGTTLSQAIDIAEANNVNGVEFGGEKFTHTRGGVQIQLNAILCNGDTVLCFENLKGAMPMIKVGRVPGSSIEIAAPEGITFRQAVSMAVDEGLKRDPVVNINGDLTKTTVRSNGNEVAPDTVIPPSPGTIVIALYENLKGA